VTGRRGRRCKYLLDDLKEKREYCHLKEEALDRTIWRACYGRGFGPVVRQTAKWMTEWLYIFVYIYIYMCVCVCVCVCQNEHESNNLHLFSNGHFFGGEGGAGWRRNDVLLGRNQVLTLRKKTLYCINNKIIVVTRIQVLTNVNRNQKFKFIIFLHQKVKVKQSHYRPEEDLTFPGG